MAGITLHEVEGDLLIHVPNEATVIGRGQFLQVTDKRVSRSHALLEVSDGKLFITPTHTNPCFLRTTTSKEQKTLTRDVKQLLEDGDEFGLLPDQLFYRVSYPQVKNEEKDLIKKVEETNEKDESKSEKVSNGSPLVTKAEEKPPRKGSNYFIFMSYNITLAEYVQDAVSFFFFYSESSVNNSGFLFTYGVKDKDDSNVDMAMPVDKTRVLPDWMIKAAGSPTKTTTAPKKPAAKKQPGESIHSKQDTESDEGGNEGDEEEELGEKEKTAKDSDDDYQEEPSDDDYVPEKTSKAKGGRGKRKISKDSEEELSDDDDDDYSPRKGKSKAGKKTPKGKGRAKGKKAAVSTPRKTPARRRSKKRASDDEEEEEVRSTRRRHDDEEAPAGRPQRAARQKRGSYVDDPMIEEALEDFASDGDDDANEDKDSDFEVEGEEESGSDWEKSTGNSQKQKGGRSSRNRGPPKGPSKKAVGKRKGSRRASHAKEDSDEEDIEDDEPYVPRPSKRRGGAVSRDSEDSDEGAKKKRKREPCQYGKKCYRKNPVHFRTYCHPGDSSFDDEEGEEKEDAKESSKKDSSKTSKEKPSRPQRSTAGTRLVTHGGDEDDLPDTYDNDSLVDDGTQPTDDESEPDDSDYDVGKDGPDAKKGSKNSKVTKPVGKAVESD
ncbi:unnamed protein product [Lymnaea stagnalis]|uniref:Aprataxin and PNK-like factor n=1 Tax=Lymnaea stagnalis TaxID=6523 RepID=A0AAV2IFH7_LYMST